MKPVAILLLALGCTAAVFADPTTANQSNPTTDSQQMGHANRVHKEHGPVAGQHPYQFRYYDPMA